MALTPQQQAFVEAYTGNATEAALKAGYSPQTARVQGPRLLQNVAIAAAIRDRQAKAIRPLIATREDRQRFWTQVMQDDEEDMRNRLKAAELLGKSEADFVERHQHSGGVSIGVVDPYAKPTEES